MANLGAIRESKVEELLQLRECLNALELSNVVLDEAQAALERVEARYCDLVAQFQQQNVKLEQALNFEATLQRILDKVRDSLDEAQILHTAVRELALALDVDRCNTATYDLEQKTLTIHYEYAKIHPQQGRVSSIAAVMDIYPQLLAGECIQFCRLGAKAGSDVEARLACPIYDEQGLIGDLWLCHQKEHIFDSMAVRLVQQVASQCAIAIRQARLYQEAQAKVDKLQQLNDMKDEFLSTVSHELRTPLANIKVAINLLKMASSDEKRAQYCAILEQECNREITLIQDLLDLQQLEEGECSMEMEIVYLQELLPHILSPFKSRMEANQLRLQVQLQSDLPPLRSNPSTLERILAELINNACKYTPAGGNIAVTAQHSILSSPAIQVVVCNDGEISTQELPQIFDKFYRAHQVERWKQGGTGLGLALTQKLVEALGGRISADSQDGRTKFTVEFSTDIKGEPFSC